MGATHWWAWRWPVAAVLVVLAPGCLALTACAGADPGPGGWAAPPPGAAPDYQLGGPYTPDPRVGVVVRDSTAQPAGGVYSVCYVNAFQTQPGERSGWDDDLVLRRDGRDVTDPAWPDEALLDTRGPERRAAIARTVGEVVRGCAEKGFDAVELDNLDSWTRSGGALTPDDAASLARALVATAHSAGLAAGQKNAVEESARLRTEAGFDFAVVEGCAAFDECAAATDAYGGAVIAVEYTDALPAPFAEVCADPATPASVVLRDRALAPPGAPGHAFGLC